jgi:UDPglucose 6-dehydrogenase
VKQPLGIFGAGWVGLVTGACFAERGHEVVVRDVLPERIESLNAGRLPFHEPGLADLIERNRERLTFTLDVAELKAGTDLFFACVDTPPTASGDADLSYVWSVIDDLGGATGRAGKAGTASSRHRERSLSGEATLVMKSTVPVGTGERVRAALDQRGLAGVGYVSNPEFLAEGTAVKDFMSPDRVVVGSFDEAAGDRVAALYEGFDAPVVRTSVASAEMIKLAANAFLATRISFINEIANVSEAVGADVAEVAYGMGLDKRIGTSYLNPGIGYGGSCLVGEETVLIRRRGRASLTNLETLFEELARDEDVIVAPDGLEALSWDAEGDGPEFRRVAALTRRWYEGDILEVRTKMGRRVRCTPDHPFVAGPRGAAARVKQASELTTDDWLPLAQGQPGEATHVRDSFDLLEGLEHAGLTRRDVIVRRERSELAQLGTQAIRAGLSGVAVSGARALDIIRAGALRLHEQDALGLDEAGAALGTARNGTYVPAALPVDEFFWRVVGFYLAEGHCAADGNRRRLTWSFHPRDEFSFVEELLRFWRTLGVKTTFQMTETAAMVNVSSRLLAGWWLGVLGLGANCYEQSIPDAIWEAPESHKRALMSGLWLGDGSWSFVNGGPSVVLEYGTVSAELADGVLRLLGDLEIVASMRIGRTRKSTRDTYWLRISGAEQVERLFELVKAGSRDVIADSLARQSKRIAPTGYERRSLKGAWVRVVDVDMRPFRGYVYSLEVPGTETFVTTGGLVVHNCFPKDVSFLKLLAGNSGYHFQLVSAVIEVNDLQKRRVVSKLQDRLGNLRGKKIALLGLAFKPNTDDMREAPSLVLASRLQAEGALVHAWDPLVESHPGLDGVVMEKSLLDAVRDADAAVIVTEWPELESLASEEVRQAMRTPLIVDGRNLLDPEAARSAGFDYEGIGRAQ